MKWSWAGHINRLKGNRCASRANITYKDRRTNIWDIERTNVIDIMYSVRKMKWSWAGHINRLKGNRWTSRANITYKDRGTNIWDIERTNVIDIMYSVRKMKWSWAGHIYRLKGNRWTSRATNWRPHDKIGRQGETTWTTTGATRYGR